MKYWLLKSEGTCYPISELKRDKKTSWTGIRNYQARNFMMKDMSIGDLCLFYHSTSKPSGIYGLAKVSSKPHVDETQFDKKDEHYDPKATQEKPIWYCVDISFLEAFKSPISLDQIKFDTKLDGMMVRAQGSRLSIQPVEEKHFRYIVEKMKP